MCWVKVFKVYYCIFNICKICSYILFSISYSGLLWFPSFFLVTSQLNQRYYFFQGTAFVDIADPIVFVYGFIFYVNFVFSLCPISSSLLLFKHYFFLNFKKWMLICQFQSFLYIYLRLYIFLWILIEMYFTEHNM